MRCLINYRLRLGDIVACFPAAKLLADQGHSVSFSCYAAYHDIFKTISYARPVLPPECNDWQKKYDRFYDLEIRRSEYDRYRESKIPWRHYVYGKYPDFDPVRDTMPIFDRIPSIESYRLPQPFALAAPFGISQSYRINLDWFFEICRSIAREPLYVLTPPGKSVPARWGRALVARSIADLPGLIQSAATFVTINSAPNVIAAGVRKSYYHVYEAGFDGQNNYYAPQQIRLKQPEHLDRPSWRHRVNQARYRIINLFK